MNVSRAQVEEFLDRLDIALYDWQEEVIMHILNGGTFVWVPKQLGSYLEIIKKSDGE